MTKANSVRCSYCDLEINLEELSFKKGKALCPRCKGDILLPEIDWKNIHSFSLEMLSKGLSYKKNDHGFTLTIRNNNYVEALIIGLMVPLVVFGVIGIILQARSGFEQVLIVLSSMIIVFFAVHNALISAWGKVKLQVQDNDATLFCGVGIFGRIRRFKWNDINSLYEGSVWLKSPADFIRSLFRFSRGICLRGSRLICFATNLNNRQRLVMMKALYYLLVSQLHDKEKL